MHLQRFTTGREPFYARAMQLYEENFAYLERRAQDAQASALQNGSYHCCAVIDEDFVGIAFFWETEDFLYLEHLCVDVPLRKKGYGAKILDLLKARGKRIILEIEPVVDEITRKRKSFYERNGFVKNEYHHIQPKYHVGDADLLLWIMTQDTPIAREEYDAFYAFLQEYVQIKP